MGCNGTHDGPLHTITNKRWSKDLTVLYRTGSNKKHKLEERVNSFLSNGPRMEYLEVN